MKKLLNTLYVTTPEAYISKDGESIVISLKGKNIFTIPIINISSIVTFGYQGASPGCMRLCSQYGVDLSFFSPRGRFIARIQGPVKGNILLRKTQFELLNNEESKCKISSRFIFAKIHNSRMILRRFIRDYPNAEKVPLLDSISQRLKVYSKRAFQADDIEILRGWEGEAAADYFSVLDNLILHPDPLLHFNGRTRRPPTDPFNAMLSFGYSLLANDCAAALEGVGLDPAAGLMHALRPGRNSLALDLMEELRGYIVDRFVINLVNNHQISSTDFKIHSDPAATEQTSVLITDNGRKKFLAAWQDRKRKELTHPFLNEKIQIGLLPHIQAMLLARYLRHDLDDYPPFLIK